MDDDSKSKAELLGELKALRKQLDESRAASLRTFDAGEPLYLWLSRQPQLVLEFDTKGNLFNASSYALQRMGYTQEDLAEGLSLHQFVHPDDLPQVRQNFEHVLEGQGVFCRECRALHKDGSLVPVMTNSRRIFKEGRLVGVSVFIYDLSTPGLQAPATLQHGYFHTLFEVSGTAMVVFGKDAIIRTCNAQFEKLSGVPRNEIVNKMSWLDFVASDEVRRLEIYHSMRQEEHCYAPREYDFRFQIQGGMVRYAHVVLDLIPETDLRLCSLTDITERVLAQEAIRKSSERYELVAHGSNEGIWDYDVETNILYFSPRFKTNLGYSQQEFADSSQALKQFAHPDDYDRVVSYCAHCMQTDKSLIRTEVRMLHKDGSYRWFLSRGTIIRDAEGNVSRLTGTLTDITERKLHERTTNALYAISKAISTTRDLQHLYEDIHSILGQYIDAANFFISLLDEERDCLVFPYFMDEYDDNYDIREVSKQDTSSLTVHVIRTGKPLFFSHGDSIWRKVMEEIEVVGTHPAVWLGVPLKLQGRIVGAMAVQHYSNPRHYTEADVAFLEAVSEQVALAIERKASDETLTRLNEELESKVESRTAELRHQAAQLESANQRLKELDAIKSALVSSVSHELRTPLTSIRGFAKLACKDFSRYFFPFAEQQSLYDKGERIRRNLMIIENEGKRLTRLVSDFLDINRIESGNATWADELLNPYKVVRQAVSTVSGAFELKKGVRLRVDLPQTLPIIHADPDKLQQVLINLLHNACKFTFKGTVTVSVSSSSDSLTVSVADTGVGIPADEQEYIFEKFHKSRMGDTVDLEDKGTGLGLAICREIVCHYGGAIWVQSDIGQGSCFCFTLPVQPDTSCCLEDAGPA